MKTLLKNANVVNVFTNKIDFTNILIEDDIIVGIGNYSKADKILDLKGKFLLPGLIDGHMHIESTMLKPSEFSKIAALHGTTSVIADPHEITNVSGEDGLYYLINACKNLPISFYFMLPSCVPATKFDESYCNFDAKRMEKFYSIKEVLGLGEVMNYAGVISGDKNIISKINMAKKYEKHIDGHAPGLNGEMLDRYISKGILTDHECSTYEEAYEKLSKGQWIMIREGTAAKNLEALIGLLNQPFCNRCIFATDDREPNDLIKEGHIDNIVRKAIKLGVDPILAIKTATLNAAECFKLEKTGAIGVGFKADIITVDNLQDFNVLDVFKNGNQIVKNKKIIIDIKENSDSIKKKLTNSFKIANLNASSFEIKQKGLKKVRVIEVIPQQLITNELICDIDFDVNNGIDISKDILKIAVIERHKGTGHIGLGFVKGFGLKTGAMAASVSHDSHNLIVVGTNVEDMLVAANKLVETGGGNVLVKNKKVLSIFPLPICGLMSDKDVYQVNKECLKIREQVRLLGCTSNLAPFMNMSFISLPVIPNLKLTTLGLVDVNNFKKVPLIIK